MDNMEERIGNVSGCLILCTFAENMVEHPGFESTKKANFDSGMTTLAI